MCKKLLFVVHLLFWGMIVGWVYSPPVLAQGDEGIDPVVVHTIAPRDYSLPVQEGVKTDVLAEGEALSITAASLEKAFIIELGWLSVKPNTVYRASYRVRAGEMKDVANTYMLIRQHEKEGVRPMKPYHVESIQRRELKQEPQGEWVDHQLNFTTGDKTQSLSGSIVIVKLNGTLHLSSFELRDAADGGLEPAKQEQTADAQTPEEYQKLMSEIRVAADSRVPLTPRTLVFSRSQMKYSLGRNYYHEWNDRPLLANRKYRVPSPYLNPVPSYKSTLQEVSKYDIDGLAFFPETLGRMEMFDAHREAGVGGVGLLPEFLGGTDEKALEKKVETIQHALKNEFSPRIDGKLLITSYGAQGVKPEEWKKVLGQLRDQVGDTFIFLPSLTNLVSLRPYFTSGEPIPREAIEKEKAYLRSYLDVCDGIYFNYPAALRHPDHSFDEAFYREIFIPIFKSVLAEPAYSKKYLGLSAYRSHMSPERGNSLHEDGTRTLRSSFKAAMDARPDVIILPEWDEQNENTSFRPTIYGGRTSGRILRYYMSQIKETPPTPMPGDDVTVPNLILSTRKIAVLGEKLMIELLNIPDSNSSEQYKVELLFQDHHGQLVKSFDPILFDAERLQEKRVFLDTIDLPQVRALIPVLKISGYKGRDLVFESGFHPIQIRATWNWDHLYVKQPLRELLESASVKLAWEGFKGEGEPLILMGTVSSAEELNLIEVMGDDDEIYAVDPQNEFFRSDPDKNLFLIEYRSQNNLEMEGALTLKNANAEWLTNGAPLHQPESEAEIKGERISLKTPVSIHSRWIYLAIPKDNLAVAELDFNFDKAKFSASIREVMEKKMVGHAFENGLHISIRPYHRQIDMPSPLNKREASFRVKVWPEIVTEQYYLRLTSVEGKYFRSRPLLLPIKKDRKLKEIRVYSESQKQGVDLQVTADRIPKLNYKFDPERGAVLLTDAGQPFWASLGGFTNSTTGRGTLNGLFRGKYPETVKRSAPAWVNDNGPTMEFDGVGTYLELPREALPSHGAFTMNFEIKPSSDKDQNLLDNRTVGRRNGLALDIIDGKLLGHFRNADWKSERFETRLLVPPHVWSSIKVRYDFARITFVVNGKKESFELNAPAYNIGFTVFGVGWTGNWYSGRLRNLSIEHNVQG